MEHAGFPSDETFAAFLDGRLDAETRGRVVEHMSTCDECYGLFESASDFDLEPIQVVPKVAWLHRYAVPLRSAAAVAAAVVAVFVTPLRDYFPYISRGSIRELVDASRTSANRPYETRLSGGFPYKPVRLVMRGPVETDDENPKLFSVVGQSQEVAAKSPTVGHLHAAGVANLLRGRPEKALIALRQAVMKETGIGDPVIAARKSNDAGLLTDLASAWYANGANENALAAIDRAWSLEKTPEIAWNRALTLDALNRKNDARAMWRECLRLDPGSQWAAEAMERNKELAGK